MTSTQLDPRRRPPFDSALGIKASPRKTCTLNRRSRPSTPWPCRTHLARRTPSHHDNPDPPRNAACTTTLPPQSRRRHPLPGTRRPDKGFSYSSRLASIDRRSGQCHTRCCSRTHRQRSGHSRRRRRPQAKGPRPTAPPAMHDERSWRRLQRSARRAVRLLDDASRPDGVLVSGCFERHTKRRVIGEPNPSVQLRIGRQHANHHTPRLHKNARERAPSLRLIGRRGRREGVGGRDGAHRGD